MPMSLKDECFDFDYKTCHTLIDLAFGGKNQ